MAQLATITAGEGFTYDSSPQRSPEWVEIRCGKPSASQLYRLMAVGAKGQPLKAVLDYQRELMFERHFGVSFNTFVTPAMQAGNDYEDFVIEQYASKTGNPVERVGAFFSMTFVASPDGLVGDDGLVEAKWLGDASFADLVENGVPYKYQLQMQGQMWASGRKWCDFVAGNYNTEKFAVIRVYRDEEIISRIKEAVDNFWKSPLVPDTFNTDVLYDFSEAPAIAQTSNLTFEEGF